MEYTKDELALILRVMRVAVTDAYYLFYRRGIGTSCHALLEFNGLMSKYVDLCEAAAAKGIAFPQLNTHSGVALPMAGHDVDYLAEKFDCIFGPFFAANPELARRFAERALHLPSPEENGVTRAMLEGCRDDELAELVREDKAIEATRINDTGREAQIAYLLGDKA